MRNFRYMLLASCYSLLGLAGSSLFAQTFSEQAAAAGIDHFSWSNSQMGGGLAWFDYDADGDEDLYMTGTDGNSKLYRNNADGTFTDVTQASGLTLPPQYYPQGAVTGDIDNDGYREIFISTPFFQPNYFFYNNGDGTFSDVSVSSGLQQDSIWISSAAFGDVNLDGLLDLYCGGYVWNPQLLYDSLANAIGFAHRCKENRIWLNNGNGTFTNMTATYMLGDTGCALSVVLTDYDRDHDADVLVANDFGEWVAPSGLYRNDLPAPFVDVSVPAQMDAQMYGMGIAVGDYDHDLDLDYYVTNIGWNGLFNNDGNGLFQEMSQAAGVRNDSVNGKLTTGWGDAWIDYDLDGWQDLIVANGFIELIPIFQNERNDPDMLYRNNGDGTFTDVGMMEGVGATSVGRGLAMADYDLDGDPDAAVAVFHVDTPSVDRSLLYRNDQATGNHWLKVRVQGTVNNRDGFGTHLSVRANGMQWLHEVNGGSSHMSQHSSVAHLGLGSAQSVDSLFVIWPDGNVQLLTNVPADTFITVVEDPNQFLAVEEGALRTDVQVRALPNPTAGPTLLELELTGDVEGEWLIIDALGQKVFHKTTDWYRAGKHRFSWNAAQHPTGVYMVIFRGNEFQTTLRLLHL